MNLEEDQVGVVLLGDYTEVEEGDEVKRTGRIMSVPVGDAMIGRVVNGLGVPIDDKGPINTDQVHSDRASGSRRHRPPAGERADGHRTEGHRLDDSRSAADSANSSSAIARPARPPSRSTPSSTARAAT